MAADESSWRTPNFRQSVVAKIEEAIRSSGMPTTKNSMEMESHVFQKAKTKEEYLGFVARLILHVREMNSKKNPGMGGPAGGGGQNMQDPINALQTLARQGSGNQMMGLVPSQGGAQVTATNLLQTLNQRPGNQQRMQSPVQGNVMGQMVGGQISSMAGPLGGQMTGAMQSQMGMGGPMGGPMGPMGGQMGPLGPMAGQMGSPISGQMAHMAQRKEKVDNAKKTSSGGGEDSKTTEVDEFIMHIIEKDNPIVEGLGVSDSMEENKANIASLQTTLTVQRDGDPEEEGISPLPQKNSPEKKKRSRGLNTNANQERGDPLTELKRKKIELVLENLEKESYLKTLQILKLERELQLSPSKFTIPKEADQH